MIEGADTRAMVQANRMQLDRQREEDEYQKAMAMIPSVDAKAAQTKLQDIRYKDTCNWIFSESAYTDWETNETSSSLCCYGIPGAGKSILMSTVVDHLQRNASDLGAKVVYYYCEYSNHSTIQAEYLFGTLLKQFCDGGHLPKPMESQVMQLAKQATGPLGAGTLMDLLRSAINLHPRIFLMIDGLDECEDATRQSTL